MEPTHHRRHRTRDRDHRPFPHRCAGLTVAVATWCVVASACTYDRPVAEWARFGYRPATAVWDGAFHVLITSAAVHTGLVHLVFNLCWFAVLGRAVERTVGVLRYGALLAGAALVSSGCQLAVSADPGVGLSGVLYALFGYMLVARRRVPWYRFVHAGTVTVFLSWLVACFVLSRAGVWDVANTGHGSGLLFGMAVGAGWVTRGWRRVARLATAALLGLAATAAVWAPWSLDWQMHQAFRILDARRFEQAEQLYSRLIERHPENPLAWWNRGVARWELGAVQQAETDFARARSIDPRIDLK